MRKALADDHALVIGATACSVSKKISDNVLFGRKLSYAPETRHQGVKLLMSVVLS